jgi:quercetin dioxygenase-like cupin family protein
MKTRSKNLIIGEEIQWEPAGEGIRRQIMGYDGQLMLVKVEFQKGAIGTEHAHFHSQSTYVVSGQFEVRVNGEKKILKAGDGFYVDPDAKHGCTCLEAGSLIDAFSPMRVDFLSPKLN